MDVHEMNHLTKEPEVDTRETRSLLSSHVPIESASLPRGDRSGLLTRLGKYLVAVLLSSFIVCFGCLVFLTFLWGANTDNTVWRSIVLSGWATRSVTITSLVLRWAVGAQATICTSMLAAVLLKVGGVPLPNAAAISIMRYDNTGPWSLLAGMKLQWCRESISVCLLALLLSFTTLALQFSSTALLSQVGLAFLPVPNSVQQTYYSIDPYGYSWSSQAGSVRSFLETTPAGYPAFAEWISNATESDSLARPGEFAPSSSSGIRDTGTVMRAFLPIKDPIERSRVLEYKGFGTVIDTRVVCMKPKLTNVVFSSKKRYRLSGIAEVEQKPPGLMQQDLDGSSNHSLSFDCAFAVAKATNYTELWGWPIALCVPQYTNSRYGIYSAMNPNEQPDIGRTYLLINATNTENVTTLDSSDVWESVSLPSNDSTLFHITAQVTLCMLAFEAQDMEIYATRSAPVTPEPELIWNTSRVAYDTAAVARQLGAEGSRASTTQRGILELAPRSWPWSKRPEAIYLTAASLSTTSALDAMPYNTDGLQSGTSNDAQYSILAHMASATANPAIALQAYLTTLCAVLYHDRIVMFDKAAPSSRISLVQVTRPLGWTVYIIVVSVLLSHLVLVILTIVIFRRAGMLSLMGSAWAAVSQLLGPATEPWIRDTDLADDKTVAKWLTTRGKHDTLVQLVQIDGRVLVVFKAKMM